MRPMKQIDQDPASYRVQRPDGSWSHRTNRRLLLCLAAIATAFMAFLGWRFAAEGGNFDVPLTFWMMGALAGAAVALALRPTD